MKLGLADERLERVVADLLKYQWPDGGWNCDKNPAAQNSSFTHSSIALRGLVHYGRTQRIPEVESAIQSAKELLLQRKLYIRRSTGEIIKDAFVQLTYPDYHFYTYLYGLKVMMEGGFLGDERCQNSLDLLESKYLEGQGFALEKKYYHNRPSNTRRYSAVRWMDYKIGGANAFLTAEALVILRQAGRLTLSI